MNKRSQLFIIESLRLKDERKRRQEGDIISRMLHLAGKRDTLYYYIRTRRELEKIIPIFGKSKYQYLHISCHANKHSFDTTFDSVSYFDLGTMLKPYLRGRRIFVSACKMATTSLADQLFADSRLLSLIGPKKNIYFDDCAAFWTSFYHLMFKIDHSEMVDSDLEVTVKQLAKLYDVKMNYFFSDNGTFKSKSFP